VCAAEEARNPSKGKSHKKSQEIRKSIKAKADEKTGELTIEWRRYNVILWIQV